METQGFGNGSYSAIAFAGMMGELSSGFTVGTGFDWAPSIPASSTRTVVLNPGVGYACGIRAATVEETTISGFAANAGVTDRYDVVVASWNWALGDVEFKILQGGSTPAAVNDGASINSAQLNKIPGVRYDGAVLMVRVRPGVTTFVNADITDLRVWRTSRGRITANVLFREYRDDYMNLSPVDPFIPLSPNGGWLNITGHALKLYHTSHGTIRGAGWFRNGGPFRVGDNPNIPQTPLTIPSDVRQGFLRPATQQEFKMSNSHASYPITCAILPSGQIRMDKDNTGISYPANTAFFIDDLEYHPSYVGG